MQPAHFDCLILLRLFHGLYHGKHFVLDLLVHFRCLFGAVLDGVEVELDLRLRAGRTDPLGAHDNLIFRETYFMAFFLSSGQRDEGLRR